jgi:hypothetical protein
VKKWNILGTPGLGTLSEVRARAKKKMEEIEKIWKGSW